MEEEAWNVWRSVSVLQSAVKLAQQDPVSDEFAVFILIVSNIQVVDIACCDGDDVEGFRGDARGARSIRMKVTCSEM